MQAGDGDRHLGDHRRAGAETGRVGESQAHADS
jgi:hypothetical protein